MYISLLQLNKILSICYSDQQKKQQIHEHYPHPIIDNCVVYVIWSMYAFIIVIIIIIGAHLSENNSLLVWLLDTWIIPYVAESLHQMYCTNLTMWVCHSSASHKLLTTTYE